ncbi:MAG: hypothetical protein LBK95_07590 [Bifidobacteriaceae bacterium]|nr:hypothetical protein [Bifidobacteriaceae bacterium]
MRLTVEQAGGSISDAALGEAARFTGGFPFLIQLVGYHAWREATPRGAITRGSVRHALSSATDDMDQMILQTTLAELSRRDVDFLRAMTKDDDQSQIAMRLGISNANAGQYRRRLIDAGVIEAARRGWVRFELPLLRDYLLRNPD